jgi:hypothetical protein
MMSSSVSKVAFEGTVRFTRSQAAAAIRRCLLYGTCDSALYHSLLAEVGEGNAVEADEDEEDDTGTSREGGDEADAEDKTAVEAETEEKIGSLLLDARSLTEVVIAMLLLPLARLEEALVVMIGAPRSTSLLSLLSLLPAWRVSGDRRKQTARELAPEPVLLLCWRLHEIQIIQHDGNGIVEEVVQVAVARVRLGVSRDVRKEPKRRGCDLLPIDHALDGTAEGAVCIHASLVQARRRTDLLHRGFRGRRRHLTGSPRARH